MMMKKKPSSQQIGRRTWNLLRMALLWARKGGVFKNRLMMDHFRMLPKFIKSLGNHHHSKEDQQWGALHYGERQLSFDETPIIHVRMSRPSSLRFKIPNIPCINPHPVDFDDDFDAPCARKSFYRGAEEEDEFDFCEEEVESVGCDEGIDRKAEEFIAKFYQQMKMQRQISYLQYNEMNNRGAN